jgi:hypothetical protein
MARVLRVFLPLLIVAVALADEDPWAKVQELKSGAEVRILRVDSKEAVQGKLDRASDESVIVVTKSEQLSILKEEIERIDVRTAPAQSRVKGTRIGRKIAPRGAEATGNTMPGSNTSVSTGLQRSGSFETIYRRTPAAKK